MGPRRTGANASTFELLALDKARRPDLAFEIFGSEVAARRRHAGDHPYRSLKQPVDRAGGLAFAASGAPALADGVQPKMSTCSQRVGVLDEALQEQRAGDGAGKPPDGDY